MNNVPSKSIAEIIGMSAIVASLIFVGVQLRLEQLIARTEMASVSAEVKLQINQKLSEPELAAAYSKMLTNARETFAAPKHRIN